MPLPIPTDEQLRADCEAILADHARYNWPRSLTVDGHLWGEWLKAAETALDCEDFSEIRWMRDLPDPEASITSAWERRQEHLAAYADLRRDEALLGGVA